MDKATKETTSQPAAPKPVSRTRNASLSSFRIYLIATSSIVVCIAILLGLPPFRTSSKTTATFHIENVPVSKVLRQNLALARHSWEHGVLTHALLELQNPELTIFAGPGYGFNLRNPNKGPGGKAVELAAFPGGLLPRCGGGTGSGSWGRYDDWTKVKGLRYAASKIKTTATPRSVIGQSGRAHEKTRQWLTESESAADAASLGWTALLLERTGAEDPANPVSVGRNAYGEAADEMVRWLVQDNPKYYAVPKGEVKQAQFMREVGASNGTTWAISHRADSVQLWADSVFMVPPFLAVYAVARRDERWLWEAFEQIRAYGAVLVEQELELNGQVYAERETSAKEGRIGLWKHIITEPRVLASDECCHDESYWLTGNAWAFAGIVRVLGVLKRWRFDGARITANEAQNRNIRRVEAISLLEEMVNSALAQLKISYGESQKLLPNYLDEPESEVASWAFGDAAGTALIVSSIYRLGQLGSLGDRSMISWADSLYNVVAQHIDEDGFLGQVTTVSEVPGKVAVNATAEGQSFALLMFAARRDCVAGHLRR